MVGTPWFGRPRGLKLLLIDSLATNICSLLQVQYPLGDAPHLLRKVLFFGWKQ
jgi:hypothetical protein